MRTQKRINFMRTDEQRTAKREIIPNIVNQGGWGWGREQIITQPRRNTTDNVMGISKPLPIKSKQKQS